MVRYSVDLTIEEEATLTRLAEEGIGSTTREVSGEGDDVTSEKVNITPQELFEWQVKEYLRVKKSNHDTSDRGSLTPEEVQQIIDNR